MSELVRLLVGPKYADNNARLGKLMLFFRTERGLSRLDAAEAIGISSEFVRSIEGGHRVPAAKTAETFLTTYEVPYERKVNDGHLVLIFHGHHVEFTSRIQERRKDENGHGQILNRDETIGRIVSLLSIADDATLRHIHHKLKTGD